eukprot:367090-Amphidinium_carterae.2
MKRHVRVAYAFAGVSAASVKLPPEAQPNFDGLKAAGFVSNALWEVTSKTRARYAYFQPGMLFTQMLTAQAFLSSQPSNAMDQSSDNLAPLFVLPFVPEPQLRPGLKFIFEDT